MQTIEKDEFLNVMLQGLNNQKDTFSVVKIVFNRKNFSKKQRNLTHTNTQIYTQAHTLKDEDMHTQINKDEWKTSFSKTFAF